MQFVKGAWGTGERAVLARFPELVTSSAMGEGFTWDTQDRARDIAAARAAWEAAKAMIADPSYRMVLLDELNIVLRYDYLPLDEVMAALKRKPRDLHVVVTGRNAPAPTDRDRRPRHRDDAGQAPVPRRGQGAGGDRVLMATGPHPPTPCGVGYLPLPRCGRGAVRRRVSAYPSPPLGERAG